MFEYEFRIASDSLAFKYVDDFSDALLNFESADNLRE